MDVRCHPEWSARKDFPTGLFSGSPTSVAFALVGVIVRGIVIEDEVNLEFFWDGSVQLAQEAEELLVAVTGLAVGEDRAGGDIQSRK